jgi:hypothetical protein
MTDRNSRIRDPAGGLFVAAWQEHRAAVVVPPEVHEIGDLGLALVNPWITPGHRSVPSIERWVDLADLWQEARLPGNFLARIARDRVLQALVASIGSVIGGRDWAQRERAILTAGSGEPQLVAWRQAASTMAGNHRERIVASEIQHSIWDVVEETADDRVDLFVRYLKRLVPHTGTWTETQRLSGFLLRLATSPSETKRWAGPLLLPGIEFVIANGVLIRAARLFALGVHLHSTTAPRTTCYAGWDWP